MKKAIWLILLIAITIFGVKKIFDLNLEVKVNSGNQENNQTINNDNDFIDIYQQGTTNSEVNLKIELNKKPPRNLDDYKEEINSHLPLNKNEWIYIKWAKIDDTEQEVVKFTGSIINHLTTLGYNNIQHGWVDLAPPLEGLEFKTVNDRNENKDVCSSRRVLQYYPDRADNLCIVVGIQK